MTVSIALQTSYNYVFYNKYCLLQRLGGQIVKKMMLGVLFSKQNC